MGTESEPNGTEPEIRESDPEMSTDHDERVGLVVAERYRVQRVLGVGGMGGVYEAEHLLIGKKVALKCLHREYARDRDIVERFKREARAATLIGNDHIIDVTDMGDLPDGSPFLVMEYLAGRPLAALCDLGPLPIKRALHIARQICSALGAAHDKGIVHRDLKPENVFLVERNGDPDFVKVLDFGISKMHSTGVDKGLTRTGMAMGTPSYMSPEQAQGSKLVDHRTDVWALGVMLYEMLAARRPFDAESYPLLLMNIVATDPDPLSWYRKDLPQGLNDVVMRCLEKPLESRVETMRDLSAALAPFAAIDRAPELQDPGTKSKDRANPTDRFKATALGRKRGSTAEQEIEKPRTSTQPDGSLDAAQSVSFEAAAQQVQAERAAASAPPPAREALPSSPQVAEASATPTSQVTSAELRAVEARARGSNVVPYAVGGVAVLLVAGIAIGAASGAFGGSPPPTTTTQAEPTPPSTPPAVPTPPPTPTPPATVGTTPPVAPTPAEVRIRIRVDPADARILIAGVEFPNPMDAPQPRSLTPTRIRVEREGFRTIEQLAIFGEDQSFMFQMARGRGVEERGLGGGSGPSGAPAAMEEPASTMESPSSMDGFRDEW